MEIAVRFPIGVQVLGVSIKIERRKTSSLVGLVFSFFFLGYIVFTESAEKVVDRLGETINHLAKETIISITRRNWIINLFIEE